MLVGFPGFRLWGFDFVTADAVCFLTIEYEKKEKRGRRSLRGLEEFRLYRIDFDGHVLNKRIHLIIIAAMRMMMGVSSRQFRMT